MYEDVLEEADRVLYRDNGVLEEVVGWLRADTGH